MTTEPTRPTMFDPDLPLPENCTITAHKGATSGVDIYATDGLAVAAVPSLDKIDAIVDDLADYMGKTATPSGSLIMPAPLTRSFTDGARHTLADKGMSIRQAANVDLKISAEETLRDFWARRRVQHDHSIAVDRARHSLRRGLGNG